MSKGLFITIEGTDGSGKGTQTELLVARLKQKNYPVEVINFPRYGERSCTMVEDYLNGKLGTAEEVGPYPASVFFAIDRYAAAPQIRQWLAEGKIVIANRYVGSNMAHNGGKIADEQEREKFFAWIDELEYTIFHIPRPDYSLILHVSPEISQRLVDQKTAVGREYLQGKKRDIHEDDINHLRQAEASYLHLAKKFPSYQVIECAPDEKLLSIEATHCLIWSALESKLLPFIQIIQKIINICL
ncbi:MAG: hypothetical protein A2821_01155 [Candidatus Magasanikbacteria bacterium RIFCSPHIGHO2_01_FULL_41_23]|uniref:Thymidylate kinase n=1 Tax=Candidatus Magasanikbacteria bacterium RIFCSPLOWO2_01_FULL_40_15 TaxID=1798686 RepID=A0A1F6N4M2_9BACT|nr:MAG: hypothetical protein A2821_01155 [Candidatus Magasanikbacteria bacterium RIFCSPHIGHO2_01_FULL_41_23]OGH66735.1 MAG: hypothetical protein A3C66_01460 [Candidatus Magasanikbacteria bacterium RIFCSPHIGHO2_02_FULL_41_35]OGH74535.1 MAG: hypothetical protein A3F22_02865 [Candidatus Magasanikbacteria bacterium RIFCSPHIGHO2_12_FULL_41_16]OGH78824.1 MAG: hypothetical protein A2983_00615 [Candidatus Magasanikbacteria bacterium RIFCSPLOWO2_01_FULL_40_15]